MSKNDFHNQLREHLHRKPFLPFVVELRDVWLEQESAR